MKYVAYYRVSTQRQGQFGLGLEAQQSVVSAFCEPMASFTEVESGKQNARPKLAKAIAACKREGALLVVAKLDRLARSVAFVSALMESGVEFVACDNPHANRPMIHILAAVAEDEAQRISDRIRAALAAHRGKLRTPGNLPIRPVSGALRPTRKRLARPESLADRHSASRCRPNVASDRRVSDGKGLPNPARQGMEPDYREVASGGLRRISSAPSTIHAARGLLRE